MSLTEDANQFNWMLNQFVRDTSGVSDAVAVSSDGLLMAVSNTLDAAGANQVAAIISGLVSLGHGTSRCLDLDELDQIIVAMERGILLVTTMGIGGSLGIVATPGCDMGNVGYQLSQLVEWAGKTLTPELVAELKNLVLTG